MLAATIDHIEPLSAIDCLKRSVVVPRADFEGWLERHDWTYHQLARGEYPAPFASLEEFQLGCICADPLLWCRMFLREPEDPDHEDPYSFFDYQVESLRYHGNTVHKCGAETGKSREIIALCLYYAFTRSNGAGLIGAPQQTHLDEIIEGMHDQIGWNDLLTSSLTRWKKHPHHAFYFANHFKIDFRPSGHDGEAYRGVHVRTFAIKDEAAKDKNKKQWSEFWRAMKPGCIARIYSVPDGDRSCEFFKLGERALRSTAKDRGENEEVSIESFHDVSKYVRDLEFKLFKWGKPLMPPPFWTAERRRFYIEQYGGEDAPEYQHNVLGEDGDPENTVFPWHQFKGCIREIPEYRGLKVLADAATGEVIVTGYKAEYVIKHGDPVPKITLLMDEAVSLRTFFERDEAGETEFTRLVKSFFVSVPGLKRGGGDFGFSSDPTEIVVKSIQGKRERVVARLQLKRVTYDQQCQALDALDELYGSTGEIIWGTDFGNAGSAVAHDLQGLAIYEDKDYADRLRGFMFESTHDNIDEEGEPVIDAKTGKPAKITMKELATDLLVKKMQRLELEYPPDPDYALYYTNHTVRMGKHRIYKKEDDHLIDADRVQILAGVLREITEDLFA